MRLAILTLRTPVHSQSNQHENKYLSSLDQKSLHIVIPVNTLNFDAKNPTTALRYGKVPE